MGQGSFTAELFHAILQINHLVSIIYQVNKQWCYLGETEINHKQKFVLQQTPFSNERGGGVYLNNPEMPSSGCRHSI